MKVLVGSWFELPRLETDLFAALMKAGVKYEKEMGFMLTPETDMQSASRTIARATGEAVDLSVRCYVCGLESCPSCGFASICDRRVVSPMCLCEEHAASGNAYLTYMNTFEATLAE